MARLSLLVGALLGIASPALGLDMRLITYNIRMATPVPGIGEAMWSVRRPLMTSQLNYETAGHPDSLLCFQEALPQQVEDLNSGLGAKWAYVGVGRDDGARQGEFSPIFYQPTSWKLQETKTYWLSETPNIPGSVGWDAALPRIATVARFQHVQTGAPFVYMCTHFDHIGQKARENSAHLLVDIASEWSMNNTIPAFLGGDLNITPDNPAYLTLARDLFDVKDVVPQEHHFGNTKTYTAFTVSTKDDTELDHIFVSNPVGIEWVSFAVLNTRFDDEIFISDHRPVVTDFKLSTPFRKRRVSISR